MQLFLSIVNCLNYKYFDKYGNYKCNFMSKTAYCLSLTIYLISYIITIINCPGVNIDFITNYASSVQFEMYIFYISTTILWFFAYNKNVMNYFQKLLIVDRVILDELDQNINYKQNRRSNLLRIFITYVGILTFIVCQIMSAMSKKDYLTTNRLYCASYWYLSYYFVMNSNCWSYTFIWEITTRIKILYDCTSTTNSDKKYFKYIIIVYKLLCNLSRDANGIFNLHFFNKFLLYFIIFLHFGAHVMSESVDTYWSFLIVMTLLEFGYSVYTIHMCKVEVSLVYIYNICYLYSVLHFRWG